MTSAVSASASYVFGDVARNCIEKKLVSADMGNITKGVGSVVPHFALRVNVFRARNLCDKEGSAMSPDSSTYCQVTFRGEKRKTKQVKGENPEYPFATLTFALDAKEEMERIKYGRPIEKKREEDDDVVIVQVMRGGILGGFMSMASRSSVIAEARIPANVVRMAGTAHAFAKYGMDFRVHQSWRWLFSTHMTPSSGTSLQRHVQNVSSSGNLSESDGDALWSMELIPTLGEIQIALAIVCAVDTKDAMQRPIPGVWALEKKRLGLGESRGGGGRKMCAPVYDEMGFSIPQDFVGTWWSEQSFNQLINERQALRWQSLVGAQVGGLKNLKMLLPHATPLVMRGGKAAVIWDNVIDGIPLNLRVRTWMALSGMDEHRDRVLKKSQTSSREYFNMLVAKAEVELSDALQDQIDRDLPRTFPSSFKTRFNSPGVGNAVLRRVLYAYAVHNKVLGYCQSLNFVAAFLLCVADEDEVFWLLCAITQRLCPGFYVKSMIGIRAACAAVEELIDGDIKAHAARINLPLEGVLVSSMLGIFILRLPTATVLRALDILFLLGSNALTLIMVHVINSAKAELLGCDGAIDFGRAISRAESSTMAPQTMATGVRKLIAKHGGMGEVHKLHLAAKERIERSDLQVLHSELECAMDSAPRTSLDSAVLLAVVDGNPTKTSEGAGADGIVAAPDADTSSSPHDPTAFKPPLSRPPSFPKDRKIKKKNSLSDVDFDLLVTLYNKVVDRRAKTVKESRRFTLTNSQQLDLERQVTDYRILSLSDFGMLLDEIVELKSSAAPRSAITFLANIVQSLASESGAMTRMRRSLFDFFDTDKDGEVQLNEFLTGMMMLDPRNETHVDEKLKLFFRVSDRDGNGTLEPAEAAALQQWLRRAHGLPSSVGGFESVAKSAMTLDDFIASVHNEKLLSEMMRLSIEQFAQPRSPGDAPAPFQDYEVTFASDTLGLVIEPNKRKKGVVVPTKIRNLRARVKTVKSLPSVIASTTRRSITRGDFLLKSQSMSFVSQSFNSVLMHLKTSERPLQLTFRRWLDPSSGEIEAGREATRDAPSGGRDIGEDESKTDHVAVAHDDSVVSVVDADESTPAMFPGRLPVFVNDEKIAAAPKTKKKTKKHNGGDSTNRRASPRLKAKRRKTETREIAMLRLEIAERIRTADNCRTRMKVLETALDEEKKKAAALEAKLLLANAEASSFRRQSSLKKSDVVATTDDTPSGEEATGKRLSIEQRHNFFAAFHKLEGAATGRYARFARMRRAFQKLSATIRFEREMREILRVVKDDVFFRDAEGDDVYKDGKKDGVGNTIVGVVKRAAAAIVDESKPSAVCVSYVKEFLRDAKVQWEYERVQRPRHDSPNSPGAPRRDASSSSDDDDDIFGIASDSSDEDEAASYSRASSIASSFSPSSSQSSRSINYVPARHSSSAELVYANDLAMLDETSRALHKSASLTHASGLWGGNNTSAGNNETAL
eukprot:g2185.t1